MSSETLPAFAAAWIRRQVEPLGTALQGPESLHDQRVATRRLRVACEVFTGDPDGRRLEKDLKQLTRVLGEARRWDVLTELLALLQHSMRDPVEAAALEEVARRVRRRLKRALKEVRAPSKGLLRRLEALANRVEEGPDATKIHLGAVEVLDTTFRKAWGLLAALPGEEDPVRLHEARKAVKRFRYAAELLQPVFESGWEALTGRARELQTLLGDHHDLVELQGLLEGEADRWGRKGSTLLDRVIEDIRRERKARYQAFKRDPEASG